MWITISIILIVVVLAFACVNRMIKFKLNEDASFDFSKTFYVTGCPIITLKDNKGLKLNFLVDTGSNISHLKRGVIELIDDKEEVIPVDKHGKPINNGTITTAGGEVSPDGYYRVNLFGGDKMLQEVFEVMDLNSTFEGWGFEIHGILGGSFLKRYNYVIDYSSRKMYIK